MHLLLAFGSHLISVDERNVLRVWDIRTEDVYLTIPFDSASFKVTTILHPPTYKNKILLGSETGELMLWNIKTGQQIHKYKQGLASKVSL